MIDDCKENASETSLEVSPTHIQTWFHMHTHTRRATCLAYITMGSLMSITVVATHKDSTTGATGPLLVALEDHLVECVGDRHVFKRYALDRLRYVAYRASGEDCRRRQVTCSQKEHL